MMQYRVYADFERFLEAWPDARMHFLTTKAPCAYTEASYGPDDFLVFGCETRGLRSRCFCGCMTAAYASPWCRARAA